MHLCKSCAVTTTIDSLTVAQKDRDSTMPSLSIIVGSDQSLLTATVADSPSGVHKSVNFSVCRLLSSFEINLGITDSSPHSRFKIHNYLDMWFMLHLGFGSLDNLIIPFQQLTEGKREWYLLDATNGSQEGMELCSTFSVSP